MTSKFQVSINVYLHSIDKRCALTKCGWDIVNRNQDEKRYFSF